MQSEQTEWGQVHYGKLVQHEGGPIKMGDEHRITGLSSDIGSIAGNCHPSKIGLGNLRSSYYSWPLGNKGGGITVMPVFSKDKWYVMAVRQTDRPEGGEQALNSRKYTEAHYLIHEAQGLENLPLYNLANHLEATPLLYTNTALPLIKLTPDGNDPLPEDWFKEVKPFLESLLTGRTKWEANRNHTPEEFYQLARRTLACLPPALRWRIPIVAGGTGMQPHVGMGSLSRGVYANSDWKEPPPASEKVIRQVKQVLGEIENCAANKRTLAEVCGAVDDHFKDYDGILFKNEILPSNMNDIVVDRQVRYETINHDNIGRWWKNSIHKFRSEICGERWVEPPEPKKEEKPAPVEPPRKSWLKKLFGAGALAGAALVGGEMAEARDLRQESPPSWVARPEVDRDSNLPHNRR